MRHLTCRAAIAALVLAVLGFSAQAFAAEAGPYRLLTTIRVPGDLAGGFDIS